MRVVYLADAPYIHTRRWVEYAVGRGIDCHVISFRPAEIEGASVHHIEGSEALGKARYLINARRVQRLVRDLEPDIVHALHLTSYGFLGALAGQRPLIISAWGTDVLEAPRLSPFHNWLTRYALARADALTATGLHLATATTRYAPRGRSVAVVPYGVDLDVFKGTRKRPGKRVVLGTASRMSVEKGLAYLVEAFAQLRRRYGDRIALQIAGEGPEEESLRNQTRRLGLEGAVEFLGWLPHDQLPGFLHGLDVFVLPSLYEGFGVAAVEASAMGLPVVASNVHGIPDVVKDGKTGILTPPGNPAVLAAALTRLIEQPALRKSMGEAGRAYVRNEYDWHKNTAQMDVIYERVLAAQGNGVSTWNRTRSRPA